MKLEFRIPYPISTNKMFLALKTKTGRSYRTLTDEAEAYKKEAGLEGLRAMAREGLCTPRTGRLIVSLTIYPPRGIGVDIDNIKICLDSLTGIVYKDDKQIWELHIYRKPPAKGGGVYVTVEEVGDDK